MPGKEAFAIPSILNALKEDSPVKETIPGITTGDLQKVSVVNAFSQEHLITVWKNFVEKIDAPQLKSALSSREPFIKQEWQIVYILDNETQNQRMTLELKPQLLGHLRQNLRNEKIEIEFTVLDLPDDKSATPYTDEEKWQALAEKYPALNTLKNRFGLDFQ